ncbi:hybrid sensor histidine kinase/response regulator [Aureisphaera galaxeae]|uniref:ATP-binding response regulator n=1 Tax=Aureisphaera galaxeae TaxID=1538023 RepID=UPI002350A268|nr:hybrid sensor histidine kinase/response regulator [Aureisphaera galaxeae]MDC8006010.1 hybrid sensor histidine kinase/response regulator [Aureisphaera galaxeae]
MSLSSLKSEIAHKRIQEISVAKDGTIIDSDEALFPFPKGKTIAAFHPFFEGLQAFLPTLEEDTNFPCVNLEIEGSRKIVDIEILNKGNDVTILLFDFTEHYDASHPLVQEKNEVSIAKSKLEFDKRLLEAKENFKNGFLSNLNHEIRNPLNSMLGFLELLGETKLDYEQYETLKVIRKAGTHVKTLMEDMLDISKIERGIITKKHVNFHLGYILANIQNHYDLKYGGKKIEFIIATEEQMPKTFIGDPIRLNQILFNLLENAFRNTEQGAVTLDVSHENVDKKMAKVVFTVSDTGRGIAEEDLSKVFDSYFQLKLKKDKPLGEGLGLKIVKDLVALLEGSVSVSSEEGKGTTFVCEIPFEKRVSKREKKTVKKGTGIFQSRRILIVENDPTAQMLFMKTFLNNEKGYVIEMANNAEHMFSILAKKKYDLIILKKALPDVKAAELLKVLKGDFENQKRKIPVLMASGSTLINEQQEMLDAGVDAFLAKPYTKKELFKVIEKLMG